MCLKCLFRFHVSKADTFTQRCPSVVQSCPLLPCGHRSNGERNPIVDLCLTDLSRQILGVFMRHRIPATGTLQRNHFFEVRDGDFQRGINKAVANNWITVDLRNRYRYQLTTTGYAVGRLIDPVLGT